MTSGTPSEETRDLLRRSAHGDEAAFRHLVDRYEDRVRRLATGLLGEPVAAEEAAQETFVRLYRSLGTFRGDARLGTWLHRVTVNVCHDQRRRMKRQEKLVPLDAAAPGLFVLDADPEGAIEREQTLDRVRAALDRIPEPQREAIVLRYACELSYAEIAAEQGASMGTVASRIFRGLERLGGMLDPDVGQEEVS